MKKQVIEYRYDGVGDWEEVRVNRAGNFQHDGYSLAVRDYEFRVVEKEFQPFKIDQVLERLKSMEWAEDDYIRTIVAIMKDACTAGGERSTAYLVRLKHVVGSETLYRVHSEWFLLENYISN